MLDLIVDKKYFDAILAGTKTAEGRINSPKFRDLRPGMPISFTCANDHSKKITCLIEAINIYPDFKSMLKKEGLATMLPGIREIEVGVAIYESFHGYKQAVKKDGAVAIRIKLK